MIQRIVPYRKVALVFSAFMLTICAYSQSDQSLLFYGQAGGVFRFPNTFGPELNLILDQDDQFPQVAASIGAGVWKSVSERTRVGLEISSNHYPKVWGPNASVRVWGLGMSARVGYDLLQTDYLNFMPFLGLGLYIPNARIANDGVLINRSPIYIPPNQSQRITGQLGYLDVGAQILKKSEGPFLLGVIAGYQQRLFGSDWKATWGDSATFLSPTTHSIVYIRLTVCFSRP